MTIIRWITEFNCLSGGNLESSLTRHMDRSRKTVIVLLSNSAPNLYVFSSIYLFIQYQTNQPLVLVILRVISGYLEHLNFNIDKTYTNKKITETYVYRDENVREAFEGIHKLGFARVGCFHCCLWGKRLKHEQYSLLHRTNTWKMQGYVKSIIVQSLYTWLSSIYE